MKQCPECSQLMKPYLVKSLPSSSEYYCKDCNHSELMTKEEFTQLLQQAVLQHRMAHETPKVQA